MRKLARLIALSTLSLAVFAGTAVAEIAKDKEYTVLAEPQPTDAKGKVEVTEFFWYGCSHCYEFEPALSAWLKTLPKDVAFRRVPADFGRWTGGVKLFYALDLIGEEERVHKDLFDAIHRDRLNFNSESEVGEWLAKKGVDRKKFSEAYNSFGVQSKAMRAMQLTRAHGLQGVPTVVVGGKYVTKAAKPELMTGIIDELIAKVRTEQGHRK